jgi:hypothetical protein
MRLGVETQVSAEEAAAFAEKHALSDYREVNFCDLFVKSSQSLIVKYPFANHVLYG